MKGKLVLEQATLIIETELFFILQPYFILGTQNFEQAVISQNFVSQNYL